MIYESNPILLFLFGSSRVGRVDQVDPTSDHA